MYGIKKYVAWRMIIAAVKAPNQRAVTLSGTHHPHHRYRNNSDPQSCPPNSYKQPTNHTTTMLSTDTNLDDIPTSANDKTKMYGCND